MPEKRVLFEPNQRIEGTMLTVINEAEPRGYNRYFLCQCDCGSQPKEIAYSSLKTCMTKSCGCLHRKAVRKSPSPEVLEKRRKKRHTRRVPSTSSTGIKGVSYVKSSKKYKVALTVDGKTYYGGVFDTVEEAAASRKTLEAKYIKVDH